MSKKYYKGRVCKNIKYGTVETIKGTGKMKVNGNWVDCVIYFGRCRFTGEVTTFVKSVEEFEQDFQLL